MTHNSVTRAFACVVRNRVVVIILLCVMENRETDIVKHLELKLKLPKTINYTHAGKKENAKLNKTSQTKQTRSNTPVLIFVAGFARRCADYI